MNQCRDAGLSASNLNVRVEIIPQVTQIIAEAPKGKALPMFEAEAKSRRQSTLKQNQKSDTQKIAEREKGEAREKAAKVTGANRQYVSDAKNKKAAPFPERPCVN